MERVRAQNPSLAILTVMVSSRIPLARKLFCAADVNQNGTVELDEFIDFVMHGKQRIAKIMQELRVLPGRMPY